MTLPLPGPKKFRLALETIAKTLTGTAVRPPLDYAVLVDRFCRGESLSARDERCLCWALGEGNPPLVERPHLALALKVLEEQVERGRASVLNGVACCYFASPTCASAVREWLQRHLLRYGERYRVLEHWHRNRALFQPKAEDYLAKIMQSARSLETGLEEARVPANSWLVQQTLGPLAAWGTDQGPEPRGRLYSFAEQKFRHAIPGIIDSMLGRLRGQGVSRRVPDIESFFLKHLGHPSMDRRGLWQRVSSSSRDLARRWLTERNIRLFYDHLVTHGEKNRLQFWLQFLDMVEDVRIVVGWNDSQSGIKEIKDAIRSGEIALLHGGGSADSAIFLKIGRWRIVEFSQVGNATYAYTSSHRRDEFWWQHARYMIKDLKAGVSHPHRVLHPGRNLSPRDWQIEFTQRLRYALDNEFPPPWFQPR